MKVWKILLCGLVLAVPVFANETDDRKTATSLKYVTHELDTRQNKLTTGTNQAITYTNTAGGVEQRTVKSDLAGGSTSDTSLPTVSAVNIGLNQKQNEIEPINDHIAVTYTGQTGEISTKGIYQSDGTYADQSDALIDAKTFNAALKNALDSEFVCANESLGAGAYAPSGDCWLWSIHGTYNAAVQSYVSATGTVTQNGTPTPTNPVYPTFYRQGDMILRKVGDYADSYDATSHKITRRVGVKILDGTGNWQVWSGSVDSLFYIDDVITDVKLGASILSPKCSHFVVTNTSTFSKNSATNLHFRFMQNVATIGSNRIYFQYDAMANGGTADKFKQWLAQQYAASTPVTVWYPLAEPVEEDWSETTYNENVYIPQNQQ